MKSFFNRLITFLAYSAAGLVILLAVAVGLFRLFLPRLPAYQDEIKLWASSAIGMEVEFTGMDARWGLSGPQLQFYGAELIRPSNQTRLLAAEEVGIGVSLVRLLKDRAFVVDSVTVRDTSIEIRQLEDGRWQIQGSDPGGLLNAGPADPGSIGSIDVIGVDVELQLIRPGDERPTFFNVTSLQVRRDEQRIAVDAAVSLPEEVGGRMDIAATQLLAGDERTWNVSIETDDLDFAAASALDEESGYPVSSGQGDVDLSLAYANERVVSATANLDVEGLSLAAGPAFDISGRFDVSNDLDGWLLAIDELELESDNGPWPRSSLRLETSSDAAGELVMLDATASYLDLADSELFLNWLSAEQRKWFDDLQVDGVIRNARATVSDIDTDSVRYSLAAVLEGAGFAAFDEIPGVRGFTGNLRADHSSGLLEIKSDNLDLHLPRFLDRPIAVDVADGTVIWRRSGARTTILSDSIIIRNSIFESESDVEIIIDGDSAPVIDLASNWSLEDIAAAKRYIPEAVMKPKLYQWFQDALIAGRMPSGRTRFYGPLDKFPFDDGEGELVIEARALNLIMKYAPRFPAAEFSELDILLENARLFTDSNRSVSMGNAVVDARIEIPDLRQPILAIDAYSTGTLETIRAYSANSPIADAFGGQLDRVSVSGNASFNLDLLIPILDWREFEFTARIQSDNGTLAIAGLDAPISELSGAVTIERDNISSESLGGRFLNQTVSIDLRNAPEDLPEFKIVAYATGAATATGLVEELGVPLDGRLEGSAAYSAEILFPRGDNDIDSPLSIRVQSNLVGLQVDLPPPFRKSAAESRGFSGELNFMPGGTRIESRGESSGESRDSFVWDIGFVKEGDAWDFDRGMLAVGGMELGVPEVRGLHIRGNASEVRLEDWLALSRKDGSKLGAAERIRSIEISVADMYLLGQHIRDHRVRLDRSANDWLVQFDGEQLRGSVFVPYDFNSDREMVLDMERLILPGDEAIEEAAANEAEVDPRTLPGISVKAAEFGIGERRFGALEADITRTPEGLVADSISARDPSFEISANGRWVVDDSDPKGYRSYITASLNSTDVVTTMQRLGYQPGIVSDDMGMLFDLSWSGGPSLDFTKTLDGDVQARFGAGQLDEVEPGAGRVFGLMSIVALPRRLSLDFRDVFQKGFGFDKIEGAFRIDDGDAYTCNLSLEGPAAVVAIVGRAGLDTRDYEQTAVVSANVGNTLPVVGGVMAGPQVAVALLLFSQIFKDPLQDLGQVYYSVAGSWDDPTIESSGAEGFAVSGRLANCIDEPEPDSQ